MREFLRKCISALLTRGWIFSRFLPDKLYIKIMYWAKLGVNLNFSNLTTFSEKIQWLKLNDRNPKYTKLVDKYEVRNYIKEKIGDEYLIPLVGVYSDFEQIDFDKLPNQFVLKSTHDSGGVVICKNKKSFNIEAARKKIKKSLRRNYYFVWKEWPYKNIKPRIICEEYLSLENKLESVEDYKFYCFNGEPKYCQVIRDRNTEEKIDFYDLEWNRMRFTGLHFPGKPYPNSIKNHKKPEKFDEMVNIAKKLSQDHPFIRVDLYSVNNKVLFGELTLYPLSGFGTFEPLEWNLKMGELIKLPLDN